MLVFNIILEVSREFVRIPSHVHDSNSDCFRKAEEPPAAAAKAKKKKAEQEEEKTTKLKDEIK